MLNKKNLPRIALALSLITAAPLAWRLTAADSDANAVALEALSRIEGNIDESPALKKAVLRLLEKTRGNSAFVQIVRKFDFKDYDDDLLGYAIENPATEAGVDAVRLVLEHKNDAAIKKRFEGSDSDAAKLADALGNTEANSAIPFLQAVVVNPQRTAALRKAAIKALAQTADGARVVLDMAKQDKLGDDVRFVAANALQNARWPDVKKSAMEIFPAPASRNAEPLPPVSELLKIAGDPGNGEKIFYREEPGCFHCHMINGKGTDFGPGLSEIGAKLGKDAIYEAILDPSAGISMGFEAYSIELKSGDEFVGLLASETADEIVIKDQKAIPKHYKKSDIVRREKQKTSIMPNGLQMMMTQKELVDLVDFLSSLKKAKTP